MLDDLKSMLNDIEQENDWEFRFIESILIRKEQDPSYKLSGKQFRTLQNIHSKYCEGVSPYSITPLLMLLDQPGLIRAYKLVNSNLEGIYKGGIIYEMDVVLSVDDADPDVTRRCGAGINVATLDWCIAEWRQSYRILIVEFEAKDIACIPTATDGKFRLHRCKVVGEKCLKELGLIGEGK